MVDEWDEFEKMRDEIKIQEIIKKGEDNMKFNVLVRLTKDYQVAEVGVEEIDNERDFEYARNFARTQAESLLDSYAVEDKPKASTQTYTKQYSPNTQGKPQPPVGKVTLGDILVSHGSDKQKGFLVDGINKGYFTLEAINSCQTYQDVSNYVKKFFEMNKKK